MADKTTIVSGTTQNEACGVADAAFAPSRHTSAPTAATVCEKISTSEAATGGATIKSPGFREYWGNFWNGVTTAAKIMTEVVEVTTQVAGSPTVYKKQLRDKNNNILFEIALDTVWTTFTFFDSVASAATYLLPNATYEGTIGSWLVHQTKDLPQGIYNRGWTAASGRPAHIRRVFANATAADVLDEIQDDGTSGTAKAQHRTYGDGATENGCSIGSGGGLIERMATGTWNDAAAHALWTSEVIAEKSAVVLDVMIVAEKADGTTRGRWHLLGTFFRQTAGNIDQQGATDPAGSDPWNPTLWTADFGLDVVTQTIVVNVATTVAAENVTWKVVVRKIKVVVG